MKLCLFIINGDTASELSLSTTKTIIHRNTQQDDNTTCASVQIDSAFYHYLIKELLLSNYYRNSFISNWYNHSKRLTLQLLPTNYDLIDYKWNERIYEMVRERCELDHTLSWLSTLGGGFSALGDYFSRCAEIAGKISFHQLQLGLRLGDPSIAARCRLYFSLSLIQRKRFGVAKFIIYREYQDAKRATVTDQRLLNMCEGIWAKLQYEYEVYRKSRRKRV